MVIVQKQPPEQQFIQKRQPPPTTSQNSTSKENTATKIAPATKLPPTIQEIGTKTPIIQKNSHQSPLTTQKITTIHQKTIEKIQKRKEN